MYKRPILKTLQERLAEPRRFIQVLAGPRQVGKTTIARQAMAKIGDAAIYASADEPVLKGAAWVEQWRQQGRAATADRPDTGRNQKIPDWSAVIKRLWDEDTATGTPIRLVILIVTAAGQAGLTESLAGRFELIPVTHWSWPEMHERSAGTWKPGSLSAVIQGRHTYI